VKVVSIVIGVEAGVATAVDIVLEVVISWFGLLAAAGELVHNICK